MSTTRVAFENVSIVFGDKPDLALPLRTNGRRWAPPRNVLPRLEPSVGPSPSPAGSCALLLFTPRLSCSSCGGIGRHGSNRRQERKRLRDRGFPR